MRSWRPSWGGVIAGLILALIGIGVSAGSYDGASRSGGPYVVLWGLVFVGAAITLRSLLRTTSSIEAAAAQKARAAAAAADAEETEEGLRLLRITLGAAAYEAEIRRIKTAAGSRMTDLQAGRRLLAERRAQGEESERRRFAAIAAAYAPVVAELKASMTLDAWEKAREEATWDARESRKDQLGYLSRYQRPNLRVPEHLDPDHTPVAEDWQVAAHLRPVVKLGPDGWPVESQAAPGVDASATSG